MLTISIAGPDGTCLYWDVLELGSVIRVTDGEVKQTVVIDEDCTFTVTKERVDGQ